MKKSQLRNIIRESIKGLMTEQANPTQLASNGDCDGAIVHNMSVHNPNYGQNFIDTYGPNANMGKYVSHGPPGMMGPSQPSNVCQHSSGYVYERKKFQMVPPGSISNAVFYNSYSDLIDGINTMPWASITYSTSMTLSDVKQQVTNDNCTPGPPPSSGFTGPCYQVGISGKMWCNYCTNTPTNNNPPKIWKCIKAGNKFPECVRYDTQAFGHPNQQNNYFPGGGPYYSKAECIESGCEGIGPDDGGPTTDDWGIGGLAPLTTDPQSMTKPEDEFGTPEILWEPKKDEPEDKFRTTTVEPEDKFRTTTVEPEIEPQAKITGGEMRCCGNGQCDVGCTGDLCDTVGGKWTCLAPPEDDDVRRMQQLAKIKKL